MSHARVGRLSSRSDQVLLLLPSLTGLGGGIELYQQQFLDALVHRWPDIRLTAVVAREATLVRPERLSPGTRARLSVDGVTRTRRATRIAEFVTRAALATWRLRPRLIVCGHVNYAALCLVLARASGAKWCAITHGLEAWDLAGTNARALRAADQLIAVSRFTADRLADSIGIPRSRTEVVNNAVDVTHFSPGAPSDEIASDLEGLARPRLLTVCRLDANERYKGVDTVLEALARHPGLAGSYLVIGDGTDRARLEQLAVRLGVPARFYGRAPDAALPDLYRACDLFVMPSRGEGFGYVFIEALASGIPAIAGNIDGSVDALAGGALGLLVDPLSVDSVAKAIRTHLTGASPSAMRDPTILHAEVARRFAPEVFRERFASAIAPLLKPAQ